MEGKSMVPHFSGNTFEERLIFVEHESNRALYYGDYKLVTKNVASSDGNTYAHQLELYNIILDPSELENLAFDETEILMNMVALWNEKATEVGVPKERLLNPNVPVYSDTIALVFHFPFDNNVTDTSPAHYTLKPVPGYTPLYGAGMYGSGIVLNGTSNYLDLDQRDVFNPADKSFTVCAWVYNTLPQNRIPQNGNEEQQVLHQLGDGRIMLGALLSRNSATIGCWQGGSSYYAEGNVFSQNKWQHIAIVSSSKHRTHTFYVNGVNVGTINNVNPFESVSDRFRVGAHKTVRSFWSGTIDELYLFEGALTEEQINMVMNNCADDIFLQTNSPIVQQEDKIDLYPNPVTKVLNFAQAVDKVKVIDLCGKVFIEQNTPAQSINLDKLASGIYLVLTQRDSGMFINKIIKRQ